MQPVGRITLFLASAILLASANIFALEARSAQEALSPSARMASCHYLMTEAECAAFQQDLSRLPVGTARDGFLAEHNALMQEREASCPCSRLHVDATILYPSVTQVARRY